ncbi:hypothetical protein SAMD00019534_058840 [Acytostelium subglobosum LB1]|uniref:hypothetical protein n=1 Tax=Acytostelium subglobosum LB1 TaxID=1410327 RepID=UPI0006449413|nr:hypothetical protein SAMD00019534_058840 [Acytostelium subglobosum LB1]GAM22709.1 hypothetical protein SAMD00019534_058840 [Acytostelium subglobosum LB1]|eukprot:XP_012753936.1 hypothetical protein SAMD00019534_058840 [Acytostelium subglobosum LB1]
MPSSSSTPTTTPPNIGSSSLYLSKAVNDSYQIVAKIGEGISGSVYKAIKLDTNEMVALKNFKTGKESERASKEECHLLMQLKHIPHITPIIDIVTSPAEYQYNIVFPYFEHDLSGLLSEHRLCIPQVKCYFLQLLNGISEIHKSGVMHRDIKAANILVNNKGSLYIGDLGTATSYVARSVFSSKVVTLWYRPPELLLGATQYGPEVDMWSIGCVLIEMATSRNFLPANDELQQIEAICQLCGTPTESIWEGVSDLPNYHWLSNLPVYPSKLRSIFKFFSEDFIDLLEGLLTLNPKKRLTAEQALQSPFFTMEPLPFEQEKMPGYQPIHVLEAIQKRLKQQQTQQPQQTQSQSQQQPNTTVPSQTIQPFDKKTINLDTQSQNNANATATSSTQPNTLKRSLDLVNDIRNYCTSETDDENDYESIDDSEIEFYTDDDDEEVDDEDDVYSEEEDSDYEYYAVAHEQQQQLAHHNRMRQLQSVAVDIDSAGNPANPFLQPAKKQRTSSSVSTTLGSCSNRIDIPIH